VPASGIFFFVAAAYGEMDNAAGETGDANGETGDASGEPVRASESAVSVAAADGVMENAAGETGDANGEAGGATGKSVRSPAPDISVAPVDGATGADGAVGADGAAGDSSGEPAGASSDVRFTPDDGATDGSTEGAPCASFDVWFAPVDCETGDATVDPFGPLGLRTQATTAVTTKDSKITKHSMERRVDFRTSFCFVSCLKDSWPPSSSNRSNGGSINMPLSSVILVSFHERVSARLLLSHRVSSQGGTAEADVIVACFSSPFLPEIVKQQRKKMMTMTHFEREIYRLGHFTRKILDFYIL
jgi:hypothetical protein